MTGLPQARAVLVIPALDEEAAIGVTLKRVPRELYRQVVVADNGSRDRTAEIARAAGATVVSEPERGYGAACLRALAALPEDIEAVVFMDADASDAPEEAARLLEPIYTGRADLVLGSRELGQAEPGALLPHQRFGNWLATRLIRWLYGHAYTDLGPFRAISLPALRRLRMRDRNYGWTIEMQIRAIQHGLRILEVPVSYRPRIGVSKVSGNLPASIRAGLKILWTVFRLSLAKPPSESDRNGG
jgi:glycosyltransferase involved in cell wall biosynthesis